VSERRVDGDPFRTVKLKRWILLPGGECKFCDEHRGDEMMPPHDASSRCESGKRNHCTCDTCF
jgi:hypothetical protein